jgi:hypothetical protein
MSEDFVPHSGTDLSGAIARPQSKWNVRLWHKADINGPPMNVRFRGVKRTSVGQAAMSAYDPKRTSALRVLDLGPITEPLFSV